LATPPSIVVAATPTHAQAEASDDVSDWPAARFEEPQEPVELRPGYTLAELCAVGIDDRRFRCRAASDAASLLSARFGTGPGAAPRHTISGRVLTAAGVGLGGVTVTASAERLAGDSIPDSEKLRFRTMTNSLGAYSLHGLPEGEYTIRSGAHEGYPSARTAARAGVDYADLVVARERSEVLEGRVLAAGGEPLEGVTVLPVLTGQPSVLTGYDGHFRLPVTLKSRTRSLNLRFQRPGYRERASEVSLSVTGEPGDAPLEVVMEPVESWTSLQGTVLSDAGDPLPGRAVELRPASSQRAYMATTDHVGRYSFPFVEAPADYRLVVFGGADHRDHRLMLRLAADTSDVDVMLAPYDFGTVTGQLVNPNGVPVPDFELVLRNTGSQRPNALVSTDRHGNFEVRAAPAGDLVVASQSTPSILVRGLRLDPGDRLHVPLVLDWGDHQLHGIVLDTFGNPVPASRIVLQWSREADGVTTSATRRTAADAHGHFSFSRLGPGPHSLKIDAPGYRPVEIDHDLSRQGYDLTVRLN
jgi:protocatechuate 3,4-dioxygenase beta subunit